MMAFQLVGPWAFFSVVVDISILNFSLFDHTLSLLVVFDRPPKSSH